jgi:hypothetical protein
LINHRGYGHHSAAALVSMIYRCCGGSPSNYPREGEENHNSTVGGPRMANAVPAQNSQMERDGG